MLSAFSVPGTVLGPGIMETNKASTVHPLSGLVFADVCCFCVCLETPANLSELVYLSSKLEGCSRL